MSARFHPGQSLHLHTADTAELHLLCILLKHPLLTYLPLPLEVDTPDIELDRLLIAFLKELLLFHQDLIHNHG